MLIPALIFHSLSTTAIPARTAAKIATGVCLYVGAMLLLAVGIARVRGWSRGEESALVLGSTFTNAGNYAIPVAAFAFGPVGRSTAVLFLIAQSVLMYTVGVFVASRSRSASRTAAREVFYRSYTRSSRPESCSDWISSRRERRWRPSDLRGTPRFP